MAVWWHCLLIRQAETMLDAIKKFTSKMGSTADARTMKAVRFHGQRDLRLEDIPEPQVGQGQVKVSKAQHCYYSHSAARLCAHTQP